MAAGAQGVDVVVVSADVHNNALQSAADLRRYGVSNADLQFDSNSRCIMCDVRTQCTWCVCYGGLGYSTVRYSNDRLVPEDA